MGICDWDQKWESRNAHHQSQFRLVQFTPLHSTPATAQHMERNHRRDIALGFGRGREEAKSVKGMR